MPFFNLPDGLRQAARDGRLNVLVGAGLSIDAGLPDWPTLLLGLGRELDTLRSQQIKRLVESNRLLDAAQLLHEYVSASSLHDALRRILGQVSEPSPLHSAIWELAPPQVLTTNFDGLLETAYFRKHNKLPVVVHGSDPAALGAVRSHGRICKLHGDLCSPQSIVLSRGQYHEAIDRIALGGGPWAQFAEQPCLAIGYSLRDPDIQLLLHWIDVSLRGYAQPIYLVTAETRPEELQLVRGFRAVNIVQYSAEDGHRNPLLEILNALASERASLQYVSSTAPAELALLRRSRLELRARLHNFRGRIGALKTNVEFIRYMLKKPAFEPEALEGVVNDLIASMPVLESDVDGIQRLARSSAQRLTTSEWRACRQDLLADLGTLGKVTAQIDVDLVESPNCNLPIGPELYSTLVRILIDNAVEVLTDLPNGRISIQVKYGARDGRHLLTTSVVDNGPGVDAFHQARLFNPGVSTKGPGRGEGLFMLRLAVEEAGGDVSLTSSPGRGTAVHIVLPVLLQTDDTRVTSSPAQSSVEPFQSTVNVFVCDDDKTFLDSLVRFLTELNCKVTAQSDPRNVLHSLSDSFARPDVIVCDVVVGSGLSGIDLVEAMRSFFPGLPAILISGYTDQRSVRAPNSRFLPKPFSVAQLKQAIADSLPPEPAL